MEKTWFKDWFNSPYYHQLYFERSMAEATAFISKVLIHLQPPAGSTMLDVACGKGRHAMQLSEAGYDVTGIDLSEESILAAQEFEKDNLHFMRHDMRLPFWINYFDYAFNLFTSFGYFATQRENDNAIRTIATALKPGGTFVMDYLNVHYAESQLVHKEDKRVDDVNFYITKWFDEDFFYKKIEVEDMKLSEPLVHTEKVAKFSLGNFTEMFAYQKMQIKEIYGDYNLNPYDLYKSPRLIMIAEKTG